MIKKILKVVVIIVGAFVISAAIMLPKYEIIDTLSRLSVCFWAGCGLGWLSDGVFKEA